jgi:hypothetical protein
VECDLLNTGPTEVVRMISKYSSSNDNGKIGQYSKYLFIPGNLTDPNGVQMCKVMNCEIQDLQCVLYCKYDQTG